MWTEYLYLRIEAIYKIGHLCLGGETISKTEEGASQTVCLSQTMQSFYPIQRDATKLGANE